MTETKKINPSELAICIFLLLVIIVTGIIGYTHRKKVWIFEEPVYPVGLPVATALKGAANTIEPGWHFAFAPAAVRSKIITSSEALEWAAEYYYNWDKKFDDDISGDIEANDYPVLVQWDKRWGYRLYGNNFMANNGCGPTALSIVYAGLTGSAEFTPHDISVYSINNGLYVPSVGTRWDLMMYGGQYLGLDVKELKMDAKAAKKDLQAGRPVICKVGPGDFTSGGHFIVLTSIDEDGQVTVRDPNSHIRSAQTWDFDRIMSQTDYMWSYGL